MSSRTIRRTRALGLVAALTTSVALMRDARAVDLPKVDDSPVSLDVTETSIVSQRFNADRQNGENPNDQGYFAWLNRLNGVLTWKRFTLGARLDSSLYALRPEDRSYDDPQVARNAKIDGSTRYRNALYPAKVFLTYKSPDTELTVGDAYVQFGRGLVLSLRRVDELGIDTTLLGAKLVANKDVFGLTLIGGLTNPARVDEPTGRALFLPKSTGDALGPQPLFGSDRIVGASITAGRGLPVVASTNAVLLSRCAPYSYNADGTVNDSTFDAPIGTCNDSDRATFLGTLPTSSPVIKSRDTINASQSIEIPNLWSHGNIYLEAAVQKRDTERPNEGRNEGNALYGSFVASGGPITNTLEVKSYRNFYPLAASVNVSKASAFANIAYSAPPTAEPVTNDTQFGFFNACVTGGRDRFDYRLTPTLLAYGTFGYFVTRSEAPGGQCDRLGKSTAQTPDATTNYVMDLSGGVELRFDNDKSIAFLNVSGRNDVEENGDVYYQELAGQYSVTKFLTGPYALELAGRSRRRKQQGENVPSTSFAGAPWVEGEHQTALKVAPKWIFTQGIDYTYQREGIPGGKKVGDLTLYVNGGILYKFTSQSNLRLYGGQNRGGLRCVSGICRVFPAFSGVRAELTLRF